MYAATDTLVKPIDGTVTLTDCAAVACPEGSVRIRFLVFGHWLHVGKRATFGLGGYRIRP